MCKKRLWTCYLNPKCEIIASLPSVRGWWWSDIGISKRNIRRHQSSYPSSWAATCSRPQAYFYLRPPSPFSSSVLSFPLTSSSLPKCFIFSLSCLTFLQWSALRSVPTMYAFFYIIIIFLMLPEKILKRMKIFVLIDECREELFCALLKWQLYIINKIQIKYHLYDAFRIMLQFWHVVTSSIQILFKPTFKILLQFKLPF